MKQKDIALILVIVFIAAAVSFFASGLLFGSNDKDQQVEKVDTMGVEFPQPNKKYFNESSVNPTQLIEVGDNNNANPFGN